MYIWWIFAIGFYINLNLCDAVYDEREGDKYNVKLPNSAPPISYDGIDYSVWKQIGANWSTRMRLSDWDTYYVVLDYTKYADTFDQFIEKYPFFTIETSGQAESESTFGNPGAVAFGMKRFSTHNFKDRRENKFFVDSYLNHAFFEVWARIGVGFQKKDGKLYVYPFYDVGIQSVGAYWRYLDFGLRVGTITFLPKENDEISLFIDRTFKITSANTENAALYRYDVQEER